MPVCNDCNVYRVASQAAYGPTYATLEAQLLSDITRIKDHLLDRERRLDREEHETTRKARNTTPLSRYSRPFAPFAIQTSFVIQTCRYFVMNIVRLVLTYQSVMLRKRELGS